MIYKLNFRFLIKFLIVSGLVLGAVHFWHRRQAGKQVALFRHLAETAQAEHRPADEIRYLERYLALRPNDVDARERLGRLRYERAKTPGQVLQAFLVLEEALRRDSKRAALRRYVVDVALDRRLTLVTEAKGHIDTLMKEIPEDGDLYGLRGLCWEVGGDLLQSKKDQGDNRAPTPPFVLAEHDYAESIRLKPDRIDSYVRRAAILRSVTDPPAVQGIKTAIAQRKGVSLDKVELPAEADQAIDELVTRNASNFRAHLAASAYWRQFGNARRAGEAIAFAQRLAPDEVEVILAGAAHERDRALSLAREPKPDRDQIEAARSRTRALLDRGISLYPALPALYRSRADIEVDAGRLDEAEVILQKGTEALPESADLWLSLTDVKVRRNNPAGAERALARYRELDAPAPVADYQAARIDILREEWLDAANKLDRVRDDLAGTAFARPANLLMARCYQQMGELDRRIEACSRVIADSNPADSNPADPVWLEATLGVAEARAALGQLEEALRIYETLAPRAPGAWVAVARIRMGQELRKNQPDLRRVEAAIEQAAKAFPDGTQVALLWADYLYLLKGDQAGARDLLNGLREKNLREKKPQDVDVWVALAAQDVRDGSRDRAAATLDEARQALGDSVTLRLARARLLVDPKTPDAAAQLRALGPTETDLFSKSDRLRLARGLAEIAAADGATDLAADLLTHAAAAAPHNLGVHLRRFDQALQADDWVGAERVLEEIRRIDGVEGTTHRAARAFYLLRRVQKGQSDAGALTEAGRLLDAVEADRPGWSRVALGQGLAADLRGETSKALEQYRKAVEQGELDQAVIRRVVEIYHEQGRHREAEDFIFRRPTAVLDTPEMSRLAAEVSLRNQDPKRAAEIAEKLKDSPYYLDQFWLAQVRWAADPRGKEWEEPLRKAVDRANGDPAPLVTLVQLLFAAGRQPEAVKAIDAHLGAVVPDRQTLTRALCLLAIGKTEEAGQAFKAALQERTDDIRVVRAYGQFLTQTGNFSDAVKQWQRIGELPGATSADRDQAMDMILVCTRLDSNLDYDRRVAIQQAFGLREGGVPKAPTDAMGPDELRRMAQRLALQLDRASKVRAIEYLVRLEQVLPRTGQPPRAADYFLRGQLRAALNQADPARIDLALALAADPKNPTYLAYYVQFLIRQQQPDLLRDAGQRLTELQKIQPGEFRTAELQARLAAAQGKKAEAEKALDKWVGKKNVPLGRLAAVYEEIGLYEEAGRAYLAIGEQVKRPEGLLSYAAFLGRRQETEKALARCEEARRQNCPPAAVAEAAVLILYAARTPGESQTARVLSWISEALPKAGAQTAALLNHQAAILNLQKKYSDAITLYERLLAINPRDALAMNNLGYLLAAHRGDFGRAFDWLNKAKSVVGPLPELLDTEALIHLAVGKAKAKAGDPAGARQAAEAALNLLGDVEVQAPSATAYFHMALARLAQADSLPAGSTEAAKAREEAEKAWHEARHRRSLAKADLHPLERSDFEKAEREFKKEGSE